MHHPSPQLLTSPFSLGTPPPRRWDLHVCTVPPRGASIRTSAGGMSHLSVCIPCFRGVHAITTRLHLSFLFRLPISDTWPSLVVSSCLPGQAADRLMLRISQPKIQWQSWPLSADILPCAHIVLSYFAVTAFVANTADIRRPFNLAVLGRTDDSTSDTTIRRNRQHANAPRKRAHFDTRKSTTTSLYPAKVPQPSSIASPKTDGRRDARPTGPHVEFCD